MSARDREAQLHTQNLESTLNELRRKIRDHEKELQKLRSSQDEPVLSPAAQTRVITEALKEVTESEPFLPFPESVLPALLALRKTHKTIIESREYLASRADKLEYEEKTLANEQANLRDQKLITEALHVRIDSLKKDLTLQSGATPEDGVRERLDQLKKEKRHFDKETPQLMKFLDRFIDTTLAGMLAAETLGGPVVGDMMDVDTEDLAGGFNSQGKPKKPKDGKFNEDKRQRRIDEIWGTNADEGDAGGNHNEDEVSAAGKEVRQLMEELLNALNDAQGNSMDSYVKLARDSAAARFLVRSNVAQFHPKDAARLRLLDFGREIDD